MLDFRNASNSESEYSLFEIGDKDSSQFAVQSSASSLFSFILLFAQTGAMTFGRPNLVACCSGTLHCSHK